MTPTQYRCGSRTLSRGEDGGILVQNTNWTGIFTIPDFWVFYQFEPIGTVREYLLVFLHALPWVLNDFFFSTSYFIRRFLGASIIQLSQHLQQIFWKKLIVVHKTVSSLWFYEFAHASFVIIIFTFLVQEMRKSIYQAILWRLWSLVPPPHIFIGEWTIGKIP